MQKTPLKLQASRLQVSFSKPEDRYQHAVAVAVAADAAQRPCCHSAPDRSARSTSGGVIFPNGGKDPQEAWPADPPLQQLVLEEHGTPPRTVALGVGMSGHGHWSLAAEVIDQPLGAIQFDWACRIGRAAERLVSTYRMDASLARSPVRITEDRGEWSLTDGRRFVVSVAEGRMHWLPDEGLLAIEPISDFERPGTHCWRYCFFVD